MVDALANDTDIDSDPATLKLVEVLDPTARIENGRVRVKILDHPYAVPYVIEDDDGARAMALIQVPTGANGQPFVAAGSLIQMDPDSSRTVALNDYVKSPRGRVVSVTTAATVSAAPAENLAVSLDDNRTLTLTSSGGYVGPAAVMLEVTDQDAVDQKDFGTAYVSIPVQVGPKVPLLRCPGTEVTVLAGGLDRVIDIPTYCHAWLPVGMTFDDVQFDTGWQTEADATVSTDGPGGRRVTLHADAGARSSHGRLAVRTEGLAQPVTIGGERGRRGRRHGIRCAAGAAAAADLGQRARGGPVAHRRRRRLPRLPAGRPHVLDHRRVRRAGQRAHGHQVRMPADPHRGHPTLAHGIHRDRGQ